MLVEVVDPVTTCPGFLLLIPNEVETLSKHTGSSEGYSVRTVRELMLAALHGERWNVPTYHHHNLLVVAKAGVLRPADLIPVGELLKLDECAHEVDKDEESAGLLVDGTRDKVPIFTIWRRRRMMRAAFPVLGW